MHVMCKESIGQYQAVAFWEQELRQVLVVQQQLSQLPLQLPLAAAAAFAVQLSPHHLCLCRWPLPRLLLLHLLLAYSILTGDQAHTTQRYKDVSLHSSSAWKTFPKIW